MTRKRKPPQCGTNGQECATGEGFPSDRCVAEDYHKKHCPITEKVTVATIHACPRKERCDIYRWKVLKEC